MLTYGPCLVTTLERIHQPNLGRWQKPQHGYITMPVTTIIIIIRDRKPWMDYLISVSSRKSPELTGPTRKWPHNNDWVQLYIATKRLSWAHLTYMVKRRFRKSPGLGNPTINACHEVHWMTSDQESEQTAASSWLILDRFRQIYNLQNRVVTTLQCGQGHTLRKIRRLP